MTTGDIRNQEIAGAIVVSMKQKVRDESQEDRSDILTFVEDGLSALIEEFDPDSGVEEKRR